ncbi:hypothetical protein [Pedobacter terrae]|uniref:hypothetical protein n=1 Tax=Pedobacter terrae TaxID=405671 RepID=UPI002FFB6FAD
MDLFSCRFIASRLASLSTPVVPVFTGMTPFQNIILPKIFKIISEKPQASTLKQVQGIDRSWNEQNNSN